MADKAINQKPMETYLRDWRQEAANRNQFESAIFVGDKVLALTNSDEDAIALARLHVSTGNYFRALGLLRRHDLTSRSLECKYVAAQCHVKQGRLDDALALLGERTPHSILVAATNNRRKIARTDTRPGNPKIARQKQNENGVKTEGRSAKEATELRYHAGMCYLRGLCYAKQNAFDRAKDCYKDAVRIDVQCFEAFDQLIKNALMSPDEEWEFLGSLDFDSVSAGTDASSSQQAADLTKMLYTSRLSKVKNTAEITAAAETLSTHYKLATNPDLLLSKAELLFTQCRFREALSLTDAILEDDRYNFAAIPVHVACLHELNEKNALFLLSHDLADHHPEEPATWLAVGVYYLTTGKIAEARRFFSKSSMMDPHFGPAWVGFAHTFAAEGEHDQAIAAYTTSARLFQGTHLPQLFLGMQNLQLANLTLAREYLETAYSLCQTDPLLLNEMGVVMFHEDRPMDAVNVFSHAISIAGEIQAEPSSWLATRTNLGHAYRRLSKWDEALVEFDQVSRIGGPDAAVFTAKALVLLEMGRPFEATTTLHEALTVNPQDAIANDLLSKALEENSILSIRGYDDEQGETDSNFTMKTREFAKQWNISRYGNSQDRYAEDDEDEEDEEDSNDDDMMDQESTGF